MNEQYTYISQVYDKMIEMDYDKWKQFIEGYFKSNDEVIKGKKCLELGCGTGNMTLCLKEIGLEVTALDISEEMLNVAEEKLRLKNYKVNFVNGDMVDISLNKKFNYIFSFCDGYNYLTEDEDISNSFLSVYEHLSDDGYFVFDISSNYKLLNEIGNKSFTLNEDDLCYIWDNYVEDNIVEMYITFFMREGNIYKRFDEVHYQRAYDTNYIKKLLYEAGFKSVNTYNDYENKPSDEKSLRVVFVAKK
ncbi:class I SAM-dependent DNA methyltransferase [Clostridium cylindrosporum]|uniref:Putative methyltransferase n=1 Tax=Clostridium cylindrosporum DSM 605 TaxID=1121307 RepID=A0A0J8DA01_CLOCY|nr:class I SAM-dependent methyltransferase [Clostridium cylindrosporum]KMT22672.1 putative methyltransferase [Clostridium cylindrosporum DSM 605]